MPLYEHVFLARQDASPQQVEELTAQMTGIVEGLGGKVTKTENWGVRSLTYRMNKNRKAHFVLLNIDAPSAAIAEIERQERISEDVIRYLSVRVEELEERRLRQRRHLQKGLRVIRDGVEQRRDVAKDRFHRAAAPPRVESQPAFPAIQLHSVVAACWHVCNVYDAIILFCSSTPRDDVVDTSDE